VDPGLAAAALSLGENPLTAREREVLDAARRHGTARELAAALHLSPGTTRNHLSAIMRKLDAGSRIEAIRVAEERWLALAARRFPSTPPASMRPRMARSKLLSGAASRGVRVARSIYSRWRLMPDRDRARIAGYAEDAKDKALAVRGTPAPERAAAEADLQAANESLAAAIVESAEADPEIAAEEVEELREDLRRELERLAAGEIRASRGPAPVPRDA
jgi:DNA-binding CsgD family transcriptional regulator